MKSFLRTLAFYVVVAIAMILPFHSIAQDIIPTKGTEFWVGFMQNFEVQAGEELNLFIVSDQATTGVVELPVQGWSESFNVLPNQTTTVTIPNDIAEHLDSEIVDNKGILVSTQDTVAVFAINFNSFTADATKILPTPSLGIDYRVSSYEGLSSWGSEFLVVATEDDTEVEIIPTAQTLNGQPAGVPFTVQLDRGESYQVEVQSGGDFTGTVIRGTEASGECRPFAVFSGVSCVNVPIGCTACDHICEQNFSVDTWGTEFYVVPFSFANSYTYRVLADQNGTSVTINGGAPINLDAGEFVEFNDVPDVQCVQANQGISVTQYMEGVGCGGAGDPAMLILNDVTQKIDNITFSTVDSDVITVHGLNVIIDSDDVGSLQLDGAAVPVA
ncbi:MAG: IgGFc-binding protein, partial [Flavobacteriales bacterium]|nr:IgGFc-binding protein [Flavobacteriales bacterium]